MSTSSDGRRSVAVVLLGDEPVEPPADGTDVAVVVLESAREAQSALLREVRGRVGVLMGVVLGPDSSQSRPALAALREYADIIAHAGMDRDFIEDVVQTLSEVHPMSA